MGGLYDFNTSGSVRQPRLTPTVRHPSTVPTVTDWMEAVGTCVGAVGTGGALFVAAVAYARQARDRRREQANRVSAWFTADTGVPGGRTVVNVRNTSGRAIYDCKIEVVDPSLPGTAIVMRGASAPSEAIMGFSVVPPDLDVLAFRGVDESLLLDPGGTPAGIRLVFRDQAERYWRRDEHGRLAEISMAEAAAAPPRREVPTVAPVPSGNSPGGPADSGDDGDGTEAGDGSS